MWLVTLLGALAKCAGLWVTRPHTACGYGCRMSLVGTEGFGGCQDSSVRGLARRSEISAFFSSSGFFRLCWTETSVLAIKAGERGTPGAGSNVSSPVTHYLWAPTGDATGARTDKEKTKPAKIQVHQYGEILWDLELAEQKPKLQEHFFMFTAKAKAPDPGKIQ